jgi:peptide deformylase
MNDKTLSLLPDNALTEISSKVYDDVAQKPLSTIGKLAQDVLKFVALPISCLGLTAEQLEIKYKKFIENALN